MLLYHLVRRPTYILDFSATLLFVHLIITTYSAAAFPTSLYVWLVFGVSLIVQVVWAEQLCIRREMREGLSVPWKDDEREDAPSKHRATQSTASHRSFASVGGDVELARLLPNEDV